MSNKQQTAVEWFNGEILIHLNFDQRLYLKDIFNKAKEMEKNRIIDDWRDGFLNGRKSMINLDFINAKQYYNETYGGE
jgi:hypothetical protein